ncbi:uncharacterized protein LOC111110417 [Crassostrea virginica]
MAVQKQGPKNVPSLLLDDDENELLFSLLGKGCLSLATGMVNLFTTGNPEELQWSDGMTAIACFIKDNQRRSFFIRVYDLKERRCVWEQELIDKDNCYSFEEKMQKAPVRLQFVSEEEKATFASRINEKLLEKQPRGTQTAPSAQPNDNHVGWDPGKGVEMEKLFDDIKNLFYSARNNQNNQADTTNVDSDEELPMQNIGFPSNVRHVNHVGWDPEKGFKVEKLNKDFATAITNKAQGGEETSDRNYILLGKSDGQEQTKMSSADPKRKRKLTKESIGLPSDFRHLAGWDSEKGCKVDKEPLERDTSNLNYKPEQKNSDMEETQKGMHSLSHPASLPTVVSPQQPASAFKVPAPQLPSAPSGQPPSPQSLQKVASPSRTIRSKRAAPPPPPAQPPAPPQNVRQLNDHCHSNNTEPPIRPSSEENEMEKNQDNKDSVKFNSDSEGKNSGMAEAEEQMHSLPDPSSLSNVSSPSPQASTIKEQTPQPPLNPQPSGHPQSPHCQQRVSSTAQHTKSRRKASHPSLPPPPPPPPLTTTATMTSTTNYPPPPPPTTMTTKTNLPPPPPSPPTTVTTMTTRTNHPPPPSPPQTTTITTKTNLPPPPPPPTTATTMTTKINHPPPSPPPPPPPPQTTSDRQMNDKCYLNDLDLPVPPSLDENEQTYQEGGLIKDETTPQKPPRCGISTLT